MTNEGDDDTMMDELRRALASDRPPDALVHAAKDSLTWRSVDTELAALLSDSSMDELSGVRSGDDTRTLEFATGSSSVAVEIIESGATTELRGQIAPAGPTEVVVESTSSSQTLTIDDEGWFNGPVTLSGAVRLRVDGIVTDWFAL